ncbi:hypothetical protein U3516DRAFT_551354 [Neocallimastix sp. 'constans']
MTKRTANCLEIATAVAKDCATAYKDDSSSNKKMKKSKKREWFINNKKELLLTYPDTRNILTKEMVVEMLNGSQKSLKFIVSKEKSHKNGEHDHIHAHLWFDKAYSTEDIRCFDVFDNRFDNESHSMHPNIRFKSDPDFGPGIKGTRKMILYVTKEDQEPLSNWDWQAWLDLHPEQVRANHGRRERINIPFFEWVHEDPVPTQDIIRERIRNNQDYYSEYVTNFLNYNNLIKAEFPLEQRAIIIPNFDLLYYIPKEIKDWIQEFEAWKISDKQDRAKGIWVTGKSKTGKTSLFTTLSLAISYFPNIWNIDNIVPESEVNLFDDQDIIFNDWEDFRWFKGFVGAQKVLTGNWEIFKPFRSKGKRLGYKRNENFRNNKQNTIRKNDLVKVQNFSRFKLDPYFVGPYKVIGKHFNAVKLADPDTGLVLERPVHLKNVQKYKTTLE